MCTTMSSPDTSDTEQTAMPATERHLSYGQAIF